MFKFCFPQLINRIKNCSAIRLISSEELYIKILYRKFLLYVHPDFFNQHILEKEINATNIKNLSNLIGSNGSHGKLISARTLIFYIKPLEEAQSLRRVKVITDKLCESMREILETIGVDLPPEPIKESKYNKFGSSQESKYSHAAGSDMSLFFSTLADR